MRRSKESLPSANNGRRGGVVNDPSAEVPLADGDADVVPVVKGKFISALGEDGDDGAGRGARSKP